MGDALPSKNGSRYPHLDDLVVKAAPKLDINLPMKILLQTAQLLAKQAEAGRDFGRIDTAYVDYLTASNIVVELVPRHKDFPALNVDRGELWRLNKELRNRINLQHKNFDQIRELIKADNARSGIRPKISSSGGLTSAQFHPPIGGTLKVAQAPYDAPNAIQMPDGPLADPAASVPHPAREEYKGQVLNGDGGTPLQSNAANTLKRKPAVASKPDSLRHSGQPSGDELADRFARLRGTNAPRASTEQDNNGVIHPYQTRQASPAGTLSPGQLTPAASMTSSPIQAQSSSTSSIGLPKPGPLGPRAMPPKPNGPSQQSLYPLQTQDVHSMPRPPSPAYSPARNLPAPSSIQPPRTTARSTIRTDGHPKSLGPQQNGSQHLVARKDVPLTSSTMPDRTADTGRPALSGKGSVTAEDLFDYLKRGSDNFSILLIDARNREAFDEGHIFAPSIICIEPIGLRPRMSAEELEERLVLSPEKEQQLYRQRHLFELVVYYDQSSRSDSEMGSAPLHSNGGCLSALKDALYDFNFDKPLKRSPALLLGGLDAWTELVGPQALKTSNTIVPVKRRMLELGQPQRISKKASSRDMSGQTNGSRLLQEQESTHHQDQDFRIEKTENGGTRDYTQHQPSTREDPSINGQVPQEQASTLQNEDANFVHTYNDFLRRFPEPSEFKESMVGPRTPLERSIIDHPFHNFTSVQASRRQIPPSIIPSQPSLMNPPSRPPPAVPRQSYSGVSDRASYQMPPPSRPPPIAPSTIPLSDAIPSRSEYKIGRTGLTNFGATCYMNAVTQCLSATSPLTRYFLDGSYKAAIQKSNKLGSKGALPEVYADLMWRMWDGNYASISPKSFREFIARLNDDFRSPDVQHDANDFLMLLLDALHEDLNFNHSRTRLNELTPAEERKRESMPVQIASLMEWKRWAHRNKSRVSGLFAGQHMSRLRCPVCGYKSTSYETFYSISLEIPWKGKAHIYDSLANYTKEERLGAEDSWTCPNCKVPREASKQITITRAPQILVIQLKRFKSVRRGFTDKNNTFVDFPLTGLNLTPFSVSPLAPQAMQEAEARYNLPHMEPEQETTPPFEYDAYGVVQHFGTLTGGHYTALIRGNARGQWMEFNDKTVSNFDPRNVASAAAYLLFYVRSNVQ